jgi:hypothetical protein
LMPHESPGGHLPGAKGSADPEIKCANGRTFHGSPPGGDRRKGALAAVTWAASVQQGVPLNTRRHLITPPAHSWMSPASPQARARSRAWMIGDRGSAGRHATDGENLTAQVNGTSLDTALQVRAEFISIDLRFEWMRAPRALPRVRRTLRPGRHGNSPRQRR